MLYTHLDDVLGHVNLVGAEKIEHVDGGVVARERQHRDVKVDAQLGGGRERERGVKYRASSIFPVGAAGERRSGVTCLAQKSWRELQSGVEGSECIRSRHMQRGTYMHTADCPVRPERRDMFMRGCGTQTALEYRYHPTLES